MILMAGGVRADVELAIRAEAAGFDSVFSVEFFNRHGYVPLAAIAQATERIRIGTGIVSGEDGMPDRVRVEFEDSGPGIPDEIQGRVFDPFFTTRGAGEGFGLGLSVAYGIVEGHGGAIALRSAPGGGTNFSILLPLAP